MENICDAKLAKLTDNDMAGMTIQTSKDIMSLTTVGLTWPEKCDNVLKQTGYYGGGAFKTSGTCGFILLIALLLLNIF